MNDINSIDSTKDIKPDHSDVPGIEIPLPAVNGGSYKKIRLWFCLAVVLQVVTLASMSVAKEYTLATGTVIALRAIPQDPRDLFLGDYVNLRYEISALSSKTQLHDGDQVYVVLTRNVPYWSAKTISLTPPKLSANEVALKARICGGNVVYLHGNQINNGTSQYPYHNYDGAYNVVHGIVYLHYGLEQCYVPEGKGTALERARHLRVQVAVDKFGNSVVKSITAEGPGTYGPGESSG